MSDGPIRQWREAHRPVKVDVPKGDQLHAPSVESGRAYCGRRGVKFAKTWPEVTCPDCNAARRADKAAA